MRLTRRLLIIALFAAFTLVALPIMAQDEAAEVPTNGRFCVRVFEDRNNNAIQDAGEPAVMAGVVADLRPANGEVILGSTLMENAPNARTGEICFGDLQLGLYEIRIVSAAYDVPLGDDTLLTSLTETQPVTISSYGVPPREPSLTEIVVDDAEEVDRDAVLERAIIAAAGSLIAMALSAFIGLLIYALFVRGRGDNRRVTGSYPAYYGPPSDTGAMRRVNPDDYDYNSPPTR